jgi:hypothetical protein
MLKEIKGSCRYDEADVLKDLEHKHPVTVTVTAGASDELAIMTVNETQEGAVGADFYKDMRLLLEYSNLFKQLELKEQAAQTPTENPIVVENNSSEEVNKTQYLLAVWKRISTFLGNKTPKLTEIRAQ